MSGTIYFLDSIALCFNETLASSFAMKTFGTTKNKTSSLTTNYCFLMYENIEIYVCGSI